MCTLGTTNAPSTSDIPSLETSKSESRNKFI